MLYISFRLCGVGGGVFLHFCKNKVVCLVYLAHLVYLVYFVPAFGLIKRLCPRTLYSSFVWRFVWRH